MKNLVGAEVRKRRKALKITLEELAHNVGTDSGNLSRAERGVQGMSDELLRGIARELGCSITDLYLGESTNHETTPIGTRKIPLLKQRPFEEQGNASSSVDGKFIISELALSQYAFALEVDDPAMQPELAAFDRLIIDPSMMPLPGDLFAVYSERFKKYFIRKYKALGISDNEELLFEARPLNEDHPSMRSDIDQLAAIGTLIEHRKGRRRQ